MKWASISLFYIIVLLSQQSSKMDEALLNREFSLKVGREAVVRNEQIKVGFSSVLEDSRCPEGVECIWAGNARIAIKISGANNDPIHIELNTNIEPRRASFLRYEIKVVGLSPYPKSNSNIDKKEYTARLIITPKG
jgi:hypothetical protein